MDTPTSVKLGDVVFCRLSQGRLLVHRVIRIDVLDGETQFTLQGDAVGRPDGILPSDQILGKVVTVERGASSFATSTARTRIIGLLWARTAPWSQRAHRLMKRIARKMGGVRLPCSDISQPGWRAYDHSHEDIERISRIW